MLPHRIIHVTLLRSVVTDGCLLWQKSMRKLLLLTLKLPSLSEFPLGFSSFWQYAACQMFEC